MIDLSLHPKLENFRQLSAYDLSLLELRHYAPGKFLIQEDRLKDMTLFLLLKGVCVADKLKPGEEYYFSTYRVLPGEFIGLYEIISSHQTKRSISIRAKTAVTSLCIKGSEFMSWQTEYPQLYNWVIAEVLSSRYRAHTVQVNAFKLSTYSAGAYYLYNLYTEYRNACFSQEYNGPIRIWDTRSEIGNALAINVRSVDRIIKRFAELGMIDILKGKIYIDAKQSEMLKEYVAVE